MCVRDNSYTGIGPIHTERKRTRKRSKNNRERSKSTIKQNFALHAIVFARCKWVLIESQENNIALSHSDQNKIPYIFPVSLVFTCFLILPQPRYIFPRLEKLRSKFSVPWQTCNNLNCLLRWYKFLPTGRCQIRKKLFTNQNPEPGKNRS